MNEKDDQQEAEITDASESDSEQGDEFPVSYSPTPIFQFAAFLLAVASIWLAYNVWQNPNIISIIVFVGVGAITVGMVFGAFARATYDGETLVYRVPLRPQLTIHRKQIIEVTLEGRRTKALVVGFHPLAREWPHRAGTSPVCQSCALAGSVGASGIPGRNTGMRSG